MKWIRSAVKETDSVRGGQDDRREGISARIPCELRAYGSYL